MEKRTNGGSIVWKHFTKKDGFATCNTCSKDFSYVGGSTSKLLKHLSYKHLDILSALPVRRQSQRTMANFAPMDPKCPESKAITSLLCDFVVENRREAGFPQPKQKFRS